MQKIILREEKNINNNKIFLNSKMATLGRDTIQAFSVVKDKAYKNLYVYNLKANKSTNNNNISGKSLNIQGNSELCGNVHVCSDLIVDGNLINAKVETVTLNGTNVLPLTDAQFTFTKLGSLVNMTIGFISTKHDTQVGDFRPFWNPVPEQYRPSTTVVIGGIYGVYNGNPDNTISVLITPDGKIIFNDFLQLSIDDDTDFQINSIFGDTKHTITYSIL